MVFKAIRSDLDAVLARDPAARSRLEVILSYPGFHAVLLHPKGFLDVSSNRGGVWEVHDHRSLPVGGAWHELRIDVTGRQLDVYFDGLYVRSLEFPDPSVVRGGFGLLCGPGAAQFRNVRILGRDPFDPAARIEREVAMQRVLADPGKRTPVLYDLVDDHPIARRQHAARRAAYRKVLGDDTPVHGATRSRL
jgi:hypothetical protein